MDDEYGDEFVKRIKRPTKEEMRKILKSNSNFPQFVPPEKTIEEHISDVTGKILEDHGWTKEEFF